jgi:hypothetical protein
MIKSFNNLESIFHYVSTSSSVICTRAELERQLDLWRLDSTSYTNLNVSIAVLKSLLTELNPGKYDARNKNKLYIAMARQINRQKLNSWVSRSLEEVMLKLENETDESEMYSMLLAILKGLVKNQHSTPVTHAIELAAPPSTHSDSHAGNPNSTNPNTGAKNKTKNTQNTNQKGKQDGNQSGKSQNERGRSRGRKSRSRSRSKSGSKKYTLVKPWPKGEEYLSKNGNQLNKKCNDHFSGFCYKCGYSNHAAQDCRIYDSKLVLTLCTKCNRGFHEKCRAWFVKGNKAGGGNQGNQN